MALAVSLRSSSSVSERARARVGGLALVVSDIFFSRRRKQRDDVAEPSSSRKTKRGRRPRMRRDSNAVRFECDGFEFK